MRDLALKRDNTTCQVLCLLVTRILDPIQGNVASNYKFNTHKKHALQFFTSHTVNSTYSRQKSPQTYIMHMSTPSW